MGNVGGIEKVLVGLILVIILAILGIAISGTTEPLDVAVSAAGPAPPPVPITDYDLSGGSAPLVAGGAVAPPADEAPVTKSRTLSLDDPKAPEGEYVVPDLTVPPQGKTSPPPVETAPRDESKTPPAAPDLPEFHVVQAGDSFTSLALHYYGDVRMAEEIAKLNEDLDPAKLHVGKKVRLPPRALLDQLAREGGKGATKPATTKNERGTPAGGAKPKASGRAYVVQKGDTAISIARNVYSDESRWEEILKANGIADPRQLKVGTKLQIP